MWWRWLTQWRTWVWLCLALLIRGAYFHVFLHEHGLYGAWYGWGLENGDTHGYFEPIDSYLRGEAYRPDFRMPGYGLPYLLLRLYTTPQGAGTGVLFLQYVLGALSVVALARLAGLFGASMRARWCICIAFAAMGRVALYDVQWFAESFCTSALIIGAHGLVAHRRSGSLPALLWSGAWLAWAVFLKPVMGLCLVASATGILLSRGASLRKRAVLATVFVLPFLLADAWWTERNQVMHREFSPLSRGTVMPELRASPMLPLMHLLQATGGNYLYWDPSAHIRWLNMRDGPNGAPGRRTDRDVRMPAFALSTSITPDSLMALANDMRQWSDTSIAPNERVAIRRSIDARADRFIRSYRNERPWQYHVMSRVRLTGLFFRQAGLTGLFADPPKHPAWITVPLDLLEQVMHWLVLLGGLVASILSLRHWRSDQREITALALMVLAGVFIFPLALRLCEGRYLVPVYPWLLLLLVLSLPRNPVAPIDRTGR